MRSIFFLVISSIAFLTYAQTNQPWFEYHSDENTYSINASNIHPAAFFRELSLSSGIEIQFDKSIIQPINFYGKHISQDSVFRFLEKEFSTLTQYKKNNQNVNILTTLAILPKGQFQSSKMVLAVDPVEEAIIYKKGAMNKKAIPTYVTRFDHLKEKAQQTIEKSAQMQIDLEERLAQRIAKQKAQREARRKQKRLEIEALKNKDPVLYERRLKSWSKFEGK